MTDQQMEDLVERIIQRLRPPVLVMVTAAAGYRHAIRQRLAAAARACTWRWIAGLATASSGGLLVKRWRRPTGNRSCLLPRIRRCCCRFSTTRWRRIC